MTRFKAKFDSDSCSLTSRRIVNDPSTLTPPTATGSSAATPRKISQAMIAKSGNASSSANPRSFVTVELICSSATAEPPTVTPRADAKAATAALATV
jgi:hypothetical protein